MAIELESFLSEQLKRLPTDHPDRKFLRGIQLTTKSYVEAKPATEKTLYTKDLHSDATDIRRSIGDTVSAWRAERGISTRELAKRCGASNAYISLLENNKIRQPHEDRITRLAEGLEIDVATLITRQLPQKDQE